MRDILRYQHPSVRSIRVYHLDPILHAIAPVYPLIRKIHSDPVWPREGGVHKHSAVGSVKVCTLNLRNDAPICPVHVAVERKENWHL